MESVNRNDWELLLAQNDLDKVYDDFVDNINAAINESTPRYEQVSKRLAPWSNKLLGKLSRRKRKKWDRYKFTGSEADYIEYRNALENFNQVKQNSIRKFETNIIANKKTNPKRYYKYVNKKDKYLNNRIILKDGNEVIEDEKKCSEVLNNFFASVFTRELVIEEDNYPAHIRQAVDIENLEIRDEAIESKIISLDVTKSTGPDGIPATVLKEFCEFFTPKLATISRRTIDEGFIPQKLNIAIAQERSQDCS